MDAIPGTEDEDVDYRVKNTKLDVESNFVHGRLIQKSRFGNIDDLEYSTETKFESCIRSTE